MFSIRAAPSMKTNHYSTQPSASVNNVIYAIRFARGVNHVISKPLKTTWRSIWLKIVDDYSHEKVGQKLFQ
jgi:hypothetical protein